MKKNIKAKSTAINLIDIKSYKKILIISLLVNLAFRLYIAFQPIEFIDSKFLPDDTYLSLTIAKNIAGGLGPSYSGEYTNGFQPMYVFIMVPVFSIIQNDLITPLKVSLVILSIFDTLSLYILLSLFSKFVKSKWSLILLAVMWIFNFYIIYNTLNGLETAVAVFFLLLSFKYFYILKESGYSLVKFFLFGIILGLAVFARIDNIFLFAASVLLILIYHIRGKEKFIKVIQRISMVALGSMIAYTPWAIYSYIYTGDIYPLSGKAVRLMSLSQLDTAPDFSNWYSLLFKTSLEIIFLNNIVPLSLIIILVSLVFLFRKGENTSSATATLSINNLLVIFSLLLFAAYNFYIFGYWFFYRYLYPITFLFIIFTVLLFEILNNMNIKSSAVKKLNPVLIGCVILGFFLQTPFQEMFYSPKLINNGYMNLGLWASKSLNSYAVVGASQSGALGYFAENLKVINLDGVVSKKCYESLEQKTNIEYIKSQKIEYILGWPSNFRFIQQRSSNFKETDIVFLGKIDEFRTLNVQWLIAQVK